MDTLRFLVESWGEISHNSILRLLFSRENVYAVILCLMLLTIIILTADKAPQWIYQGF
jgi:hypothetical protein